jgi:hypothetical protein
MTIEDEIHSGSRNVVGKFTLPCKIPKTKNQYPFYGESQKSWNKFDLYRNKLGEVHRLAAGWTVRGSKSVGGKIFRTHPDWPWHQPSLLYNGYRFSFPSVKLTIRATIVTAVTLTFVIILKKWWR